MVTSARVDYSNIFSQPWANVYNLVNDTTNVADPMRGSAEKRKFVYGREPNTKAIGFSGYPFIIVHPATLTEGPRKTLDTKSSLLYWTIEIEIITTDTGQGDAEDKGLAYMNAISDDIFQTFSDITNRATLRRYGLYFFMPESEGVTNDIIDETLVYRRTFLLRFSSKKQVSA